MSLRCRWLRWWGTWLIGATLAAALPAETLRVATYNVANYNQTDRRATGAYRPNYPKPESEKQALRQVIRALEAEVLALQEIGSAAHLRELQRDLRREGCDYPHAAILETGDEPRYLAVLSRRPLLAQRRHEDLTFLYRGETVPVRRGLLEVRFLAGGQELTLFVVHLKSRYTEQVDDPMSAERRAGEATAIRDRILELFPSPAEARYLIVGDFNAAPGERPMRALLQRGTREIAQLVPVEDDRGHRWTHHFRRDDSYSRVDHILVSPGLAAAVVPEGGRIHAGPGVNEASDHRPVVAMLRWE